MQFYFICGSLTDNSDQSDAQKQWCTIKIVGSIIIYYDM